MSDPTKKAHNRKQSCGGSINNARCNAYQIKTQ
jgi:hypothetical protein